MKFSLSILLFPVLLMAGCANYIPVQSETVSLMNSDQSPITFHVVTQTSSLEEQYYSHEISAEFIKAGWIPSDKYSAVYLVKFDCLKANPEVRTELLPIYSKVKLDSGYKATVTKHKDSTVVNYAKNYKTVDTLSGYQNIESTVFRRQVNMSISKQRSDLLTPVAKSTITSESVLNTDLTVFTAMARKAANQLSSGKSISGKNLMSVPFN